MNSVKVLPRGGLSGADRLPARTLSNQRCQDVLWQNAGYHRSLRGTEVTYLLSSFVTAA